MDDFCIDLIVKKKIDLFNNSDAFPPLLWLSSVCFVTLVLRSAICGSLSLTLDTHTFISPLFEFECNQLCHFKFFL